MRRDLHAQTSGTGIRNDRLVAVSTEHRLPVEKHVPFLSGEVSLEPEQPERTLGTKSEQRVHRLCLEIQAALQELKPFSPEAEQKTVYNDTKL